ncbi:MAG: type VI secretion system contractile sheath large subunit [Planctomycetota bacterium]
MTTEHWLDALVAQTVQCSDRPPFRLDAFLSEPRAGRAAAIWLGLGPGDAAPSRDEIVSSLLQDVAAIDDLVERQLNAILHHPEFQRLEATWRGLEMLLGTIPADAGIKVRVLDASWADVARDADRAIEFDQSQLFKKVYSAEFGMPGGEPYGVLIGDYHVAHRPRDDQRVDDLRTLRSVAQVAAAAFAPFVVGAHPSLFGFDSFRELERAGDLERIFRSTEYVGWRSLREEEDTRFVALALPRILLRGPYVHDPDRRDGFPFTERCTEHEHYLWGNAAFALGATIAGSYARWGWLADIRGVRRDEATGGLFQEFPTLDHGTDAPGVAVRFATEVVVSDTRDRELGQHGFVPLCATRDDDSAAFYTTVSLHRPPKFQDADATANAKLGALLQYVLCVSRIAHYIKVISRDITGSLVSIRQLERRLQDWLRSITIASDSATDEIQARFPLREGDVSVREIPGRPGCYTSVFHLRPHFQLDNLTSSIRLVSEIITDR